ncbi:hypothetical protein [Salmonirosea aquatica]|uniref:TIR domain-containing protein n=1 Tax=Salmonirosea aquatica TaxID=2654236 RepID=A0A7C9FTF9_9BACT|nr:hypothetical protein [Cytophagaceae bacterium SJW1-29]
METLRFILFLICMCVCVLSIGAFIACMIQIPKSMNKVEREWKEKRKNAPTNIVFIAYREIDIELALNVERTLKEFEFSVFMWNPFDPFQDPIDSIYDFIDASFAMIQINPDNESDWIKQEKELARSHRKKVIQIDSSSDLAVLIHQLQDLRNVTQPFHIPPAFRHDLTLELKDNLEKAGYKYSTATRNMEDAVYESNSGYSIIVIMFLGGIAFYSGLFAYLLY